jgi:hypothetical protein
MHALPQRPVAQQHAGLGLVIRRHRVPWLPRLAEDLAVIVIGLPECCAGYRATNAGKATRQ